MMNDAGWCRGVSVAFASVLVLSGCPIPVPPLGYLGESRTNLPDRVPGFIVKGKTTRDDVLLGLGAPDSHSLDGSWFAYRSARHSGGIVFVVAAGGGAGGAGVVGYEERLLVLRFDAGSVIVDATLEARVCPRGVVAFGSAGGESSPCLKIPDPATAGALGDSDTGVPSAVYEQAVWVLGDVDPLTEVTSEYRHTGRILLMSGGVLAIVDVDGRSAGAERTRHWIPFAQIARADTVRYPTGVVGTISLRDGRRYAVAVQSGTGMTRRTDGEATRGLVEKINHALEDRRERPDLRAR
jgi:subtilisin family serine protease